MVRPSPIPLCDCIAAKTRSEKTERMRVWVPQIEKKCGYLRSMMGVAWFYESVCVFSGMFSAADTDSMGNSPPLF